MEFAPLGALDDLEKGCGIFSAKMDECGLIQDDLDATISQR